MDSFTLNTTTAYDFDIFEINGPSAGMEEYNNFRSPSDNKSSHGRYIWWNGTSEHFDRFLMLEMDSFTLNTTTAYHFAIFEINGPSAGMAEYNDFRSTSDNKSSHGR